MAFTLPDDIRELAEKHAAEEAQRFLGIVIAKDDNENHYEKKVFITKSLKSVSFGGVHEYYIDSLQALIIRAKKDSDTHFVIDMAGRNHKGIPGVCITMAELESLVNIAIAKREALE